MNARYQYENAKIGPRVEKETPIHENVDILFSMIGGGKPPSLPLREERLTEGFEVVYNAKGTGHAAVLKEQKVRETMLLDKLTRLEKKMELKRSYKQTGKRKKALNMIRDLKRQLEKSASGISYQRYLDELRQMKRSFKQADKSIDEVSHVSEATSSQLSGSSSVNMESKLMEALQSLFDDPNIDIDNLLDDYSSHVSILSRDSSSTNRNNEYDASTGTIREDDDHHNYEKDVNNENDDSDHDIDNNDVSSNTWKIVKVDNPSSPENTTTLATGISLVHQNDSDDNNNRSSRSLTSNQVVRFKDVKPSMEDTLAAARAILDNAMTLHQSMSNDSTSLPIDSHPSIPNKSLEKSNRRVSPLHQKEQHIVSENNRYHLFVSHACPCSHRCLIVRALKRLENVVSISFVNCKWDPHQLCDVDTHSDISVWSMTGIHDEEDDVFREFKLYYFDDATSNKAHVPILWDKKQNTVISTKSTEIMKILNDEFNEISKRPKLNLFPAGLKTENENLNQWLHEKLYIGIFRCGVAKTQNKYDDAISDVTDALDKANQIVQKRGFLAGQTLTDSDIHLFVILFRFDEIYRLLFKVNTRTVARMPGLIDFMRDIYQVKGIKEVCNMAKIKDESYAAQGKNFIVPRGGDFIRSLTSKK